LVYEQPQGKISISSPDLSALASATKKVENRHGFKAAVFADQNKLGDPLAGNFFVAENQERSNSAVAHGYSYVFAIAFVLCALHWFY